MAIFYTEILIFMGQRNEDNQEINFSYYHIYRILFT